MLYEIHLYFFKAGHSEVYGSFNADLLDHMIDACRAIWLDPQIGSENVFILNTQTGEVVWDAERDEPDDEDSDDCDYEVGYDPYLGCFTDDC